MRCPKCRLVLPEYYQTCPRCNKDLSDLSLSWGPFYQPSNGWQESFSLDDFGQDDLTPLQEQKPEAFDLPDTSDLLIEKDTAAPGPSREEDTEGILEQILGQDTGVKDAEPQEFELGDLVDEGAPKLEEVSQDLVQEVVSEELLKDASEAEHLDSLEEIDKISDLEVEQLFDEKEGLPEEEAIEEIPDLEDLLPPELQKKS